jgi:hypothetical protein
MAKICNKDDCSYPVFGGGFCKNHQYLRGKKPSLKQTPIKRVSDKRKAKNILYKVERAEYLKYHLVCEICKSRAPTEIHHTYSGKDRDKFFLDTSTWLAVCRMCHSNVHANPIWAREKGYLK